MQLDFLVLVVDNRGSKDAVIMIERSLLHHDELLRRMGIIIGLVLIEDIM